MSALLTLVAAAAVSGSFTGSVSYRERMALPENAVLTVALDGFKANAHSNISEVTVRLNGKQVPATFTLPFFGLDSNAKYGVRAAIKVGSKTLFASPSHTMVKPGERRALNLVLARSLAENPWPITDRIWTLISLEGVKVEGQRPPTLTFQAGGKMGGFTGVNTFGGTYEWKSPQVQIDPGMQTLMAGSEEAMVMERNFLRVLSIANKLTLEEGELQLYRGEKGVARFRVAKP